MAACAALCHSSALLKLDSFPSVTDRASRDVLATVAAADVGPAGGSCGAGETRFEPSRGLREEATIDFERCGCAFGGRSGSAAFAGSPPANVRSAASSRLVRRLDAFASSRTFWRREMRYMRRYWSTVGSRGLSRLCAALTRAVFAPPPASATPRRRLPFSSQSSSTSELPSEPSARRSDECDECVRAGEGGGGASRGERSAGTPVGMRSVISIARGVAAAGEVASSAKVTDSRVAPRTAALVVSSRGAESASAGDDDSSAPPGAVADGERSPAPAPPARGFFFPDDPRFIAPIATADARETFFFAEEDLGVVADDIARRRIDHEPRAIQPTAIPPPWRSPRTPRANGDRDAPTSTNPTPRRRRPRAGRTRAPPG